MRTLLFLSLFLFLARCAPMPQTEPTSEQATSDAGVEKESCTPKAEICNGKDDDCDGVIDNAPGCGRVADHDCRLAGAFNEGSCKETEACRWSETDVYVCASIPQQDAPKWHTLKDLQATCGSNKDGHKYFWRGEWYLCDQCEGIWRWRKQSGSRCAKGSVIEWTP